MPRIGKPLTELECRNAKPRAKPWPLFDTGGLMLVVQPTGTKSWALKYRYQGRERRMGLGGYPTITLAEARAKRDDIRHRVLIEHKDPQAEREARRRADARAGKTFGQVARDWLAMQSKVWSPATIEKNTFHLKDLLASLEDVPIASLGAPAILEALKKIEARGNIHSAHRSRQIASQVCRYAIATGLSQNDPAATLGRALTPTKTQSHAAPTKAQDIAALLNAIDGYQGHASTRLALRLLPLVFTRPSELRNARWCEFDLDEARWDIPAESMKMRQPHMVPLSKQAVGILRQAHALTGTGELVFPGIRVRNKPMSENTLNAALRALGFSPDQITSHGFRSIASTLLNEMAFNSDVIERQLAHRDRSVRAVYNRNQWVNERREMMQAWADRLDRLKAGDYNVPVANAQPRVQPKPRLPGKATARQKSARAS